MTKRLETGHGPIELPAFMPDATRAVLRGLDGDDLRACGVQALVVNAFHLMTRPGCGVISRLGGIHRFMGFDGPVASDSGGFQLYSLLCDDPRLGRITDKGFSFRRAADRPQKMLTPDKCIARQLQLGSDIVVCLDQCTHPTDGRDRQIQSVDRTIRWAKRCREVFDQRVERTGGQALLFAVVQGGADADLRRRCAEQLMGIGFDGYGFGGWPIDEGGCLIDAVAQVAEIVGPQALKWALGVGKPENVVAAVAAGYQLLDCAIPTRDARHGRLYVFTDPPDQMALSGKDFYEYVYIQDEVHVRDERPIDLTCACACCRQYSRGYVHHLFRIRDALAPRLATIHNLRFYARLMAELRRRSESA